MQDTKKSLIAWQFFKNIDSGQDTGLPICKPIIIVINLQTIISCFMVTR